VIVVPVALNRRLPATVALVLVLIAGLSLRSIATGASAKIGGVELYGTLIYAALLLLRPRTSPFVTAAIAGLACWAVELLQLTPLPAELSSRSTFARLALGSTFDPADLVSYPFGVLLALLVHLTWQCLRPPAFPQAAPSTTPTTPETPLATPRTTPAPPVAAVTPAPVPATPRTTPAAPENTSATPANSQAPPRSGPPRSSWSTPPPSLSAIGRTESPDLHNQRDQPGPEEDVPDQEDPAATDVTRSTDLPDLEGGEQLIGDDEPDADERHHNGPAQGAKFFP
jgi:hypothetical protein